jgi:hypothetical protein
MSLASARSSSLQRQHYHPVAKILHWVIAAMIVLQFVLAKFAEDAATPMFAVSQMDGKYVLEGVAQPDRTALQVGIGEWADTTWIGQFVAVVVHVETIR